MPNSNQIANKLFYKSLGKGYTDNGDPFYSQDPSVDGFTHVTPNQIWKEANSIPESSPFGTPNATDMSTYDASVSGVVQYKHNLELISKTLLGDSAFYHPDLKDSIPFNTGDGSYNYYLTKQSGDSIAFGQGDWIIDNDQGLLTFYGTLPTGVDSANPPKVSFYRYVGVKGIDVTGETEKETVDRTIYIDSSNGSDSNDGSSEGTAFATLLKGVQDIKTQVNSGVTVTIQLLAGEYTLDVDVASELNNKNVYGILNINGTLSEYGSYTFSSNSVPFRTNVDEALTENEVRGKLVGIDLFFNGEYIYTNICYNNSDYIVASSIFSSYMDKIYTKESVLNVDISFEEFDIKNLKFEFLDISFTDNFLLYNGQKIQYLNFTNSSFIYPSTASEINNIVFTFYYVKNIHSLLCECKNSDAQAYFQFEIYNEQDVLGAYKEGSQADRAFIVKETNPFPQYLFIDNYQYAFYGSYMVQFQYVYMRNLNAMIVARVIGGNYYANRQAEIVFENVDYLIKEMVYNYQFVFEVDTTASSAIYGRPTNWFSDYNTYIDGARRIQGLPGVYPEEDLRNSTSLTADSSTQLTIGHKEQNRSMIIDYVLERGEIGEEGELRILNKNNNLYTSQNYLNTGESIGVSFELQYDSSLIELNCLVDDSSTTDVSIYYDIYRKMI